MNKCFITKLNGTVNNDNIPYLGYIHCKALTGHSACVGVYNLPVGTKIKMIKGGYIGINETDTNVSGITESTVSDGSAFISTKGEPLIGKYAEGNFDSFIPVNYNEINSACKWTGINATSNFVIGIDAIEAPNLNFIYFNMFEGKGEISDLGKYKKLTSIGVNNGKFTDVDSNGWCHLLQLVCEQAPQIEYIITNSQFLLAPEERTSGKPVLIVDGYDNNGATFVNEANVYNYFKNQSNCVAGKLAGVKDIRINASLESIKSFNADVTTYINKIADLGYNIYFKEVKYSK